jgi:hypothetical protein
MSAVPAPLTLWHAQLSGRGVTHSGVLAVTNPSPSYLPVASLAQLAEHALRKRMVAGSIPAGGLCAT